MLWEGDPFLIPAPYYSSFTDDVAGIPKAGAVSKSPSKLATVLRGWLFSYFFNCFFFEARMLTIPQTAIRYG